MKIENVCRASEVLVGSIKIGECFLYDNELHMRTNGAFSSNSDNSFPVRIINLRTGEENGISYDKKVTPVNVKCVRDC